MRHLANSKRRLADEGGFALIVAMFVLLIISVLVATAIAVASQTSTSTTRDTNSKAALEAAEAGLQVATFRLSRLAPEETQCITGTAKANPTSGVYCAGVKESASLGNGATFEYWTSEALAAGVKCGGGTTELGQRCITSEGIVNGVKPGTRLQTLVKTSPGESLFSVKGILGLSEVKVTGSVSIPGVVASNEKIIGAGSANFQGGYEICPPKGSFTPTAGTERKSSGVKVHGENPGPTAGYEKTRLESECPLKAEVPSTHPTETENEDSRIGVQDPLTGAHHTWNIEKHEFTLEGSEREDTLTLGEAGKTTKYFFCSFKISDGKFSIAAGAKVEMFIDNPELKAQDKNKCAAGTGSIVFAGGAKVYNEAKNPAAFLIIVNGKGPVEYLGGESTVTLEASIFAPQAEVKINGGTKFKGGIVGNKVYLEAGAGIFEWSSELEKLTHGNPGIYERKSWEQCTPGSGAETGC